MWVVVFIPPSFSGSLNLELGWQPTSSSLYTFSAEVTGVFGHACLSTWMLGFEPRSIHMQSK